MSQARNPFATALSAYDGSTLRDAFDRVNDQAERSLHRTTLTRWLDDSVPGSANEEFIRLLSAEMNDDGLFDAWQAARGKRTSSAHRSVVSRFESLSTDDREEAYIEIRRLYLASQFPRLKDRLSYRVEINDPTDPAADHLVVRLTQEYDSNLPANAGVKIVTSYGELGDAYEDPACIFRDVVTFEPDELHSLLGEMPAPVLAYNQIDTTGQRMITHRARLSNDGIFDFENEAVNSARITLSIDYPYPRGVQRWPIRFGEFRVAGGAEFTLALNARSTSSPDAFAFPPAGRQREWAVDLVRPNELRASLGAGGTILAEGDGLVLSWTEEKS